MNKMPIHLNSNNVKHERSNFDNFLIFCQNRMAVVIIKTPALATRRKTILDNCNDRFKVNLIHKISGSLLVFHLSYKPTLKAFARKIASEMRACQNCN